MIKWRQKASGFKSWNINLVSESGIEPITIVFIVCSTTNWARATATLTVSSNEYKMLTEAPASLVLTDSDQEKSHPE